MAEARAKFLKILKAELEDLLEDIDLVERKAADRLARSEITDYVYLENDGLFKLEAQAVRDLIAVIDGIDLVRYTTTDDLARGLDARARERLRANEDPEAVYRLFARKMKKVRDYIESGERADAGELP
ncbi:MAG TPA: hypothetical protein PLB91_00665 [Spirochaetales bacterium]|nr:hypothetical protein [Spirochaetales bacterium]HRY56322.1 hypothetical protein [Spirochaetia bacterium]HRZ66316.1 hypothetical protein [Spirochaetia bacterium]